MKHTTGVWVATALFLSLLAGTAGAQAYDTSGTEGGLWLPYGASTYTKDVDGLWKIIFYVVAGMFILVEGCLIAFCILYRRRPGHRPAYTHGSKKAEIAWTVVPGLMLFALAIAQIGTWNDIKKPDWKALEADPKTVTIRALAQQYQWNFMYPGTKRKYGGDYDVTNSRIVAPFGNKVLVHLRSKDVIHSLFIPHMRVKQDLTPGLRQRAWFEPNRIQIIDLHGKPEEKGRYLDKATGEMKPRKVLPFVWISDPRAFEAGGPYFDKKIALTKYYENNGLYTPLSDKHRHDVLYQGKVLPTKLEWKECDHALGIFEIACAELCGMGHYKMTSSLVVWPRAAFEWWIQDEALNADEPPPVWKLWKD